MNTRLQHSGSNIQRPRSWRRGQRVIRGSVWLVRGGVFLPFALFALSLCAQSSPTNALPPLAPAYGEIPPTLWEQTPLFWEQHETAVLIAGFGFIALAGAVAGIVLRPKPPVIVPPEVVARAALAKLGRQPENGRVLSEISQALRRYLIAACGFPSGEWTTSELSAALADSAKVGAELAQAVAGFLHECDQRKFAPANPATPLQAATRALALIDRTELRLKPSQAAARENP